MPVLVVDDNVVNRRVLERTLRRWRMKPTVVETGGQALELFAMNAAAGDPFQAVLLDAQMPVLDGYDVARQLRALPSGRDVPIVLLSSSPEIDADAAWSLGIRATLLKPVNTRELIGVLGQQRSGDPSRSSSTRGSMKPLRVLLAEDNATNRELARRILEKRGHEVLVATNGREAVELWSRNTVDAVLMDVQMPEMGGFEATAWIRQREAQQQSVSRTRIIAMTAHAMKGDAERCIAAGMDAYLPKPLDRARLLQVLEASPRVEAPAAAPAGEACDFAAFVARVGGDIILARQMAGIFLGDADRLVAAVRDAIVRADAGDLKDAAHAYKGAASNFNAAAVVRAATELEKMARLNDLTGAAAMLDVLERESGAMLRVLRLAIEDGTVCAS
jgi:CheY-like chemotaxis protein/HPt (histidine-containing phosphotransfer) domain-containing protein